MGSPENIFEALTSLKMMVLGQASNPQSIGSRALSQAHHQILSQILNRVLNRIYNQILILGFR